MRDDLRFSTADGRFALEMPHRYVRELEKFVARAGSRETGGILLGRYSLNLRTACVRRVVGPPADSTMGSTWFVRGVRGLQEVLLRAWKTQEYYLGEWHYHPGTPEPSGTDVRQMRAIAESDEYRCPEPVLCIVGSGNRMRCFVATRNQEWIEMGEQGPDVP